MKLSLWLIEKMGGKTKYLFFFIWLKVDFSLTKNTRKTRAKHLVCIKFWFSILSSRFSIPSLLQLSWLHGIGLLFYENKNNRHSHVHFTLADFLLNLYSIELLREQRWSQFSCPLYLDDFFFLLDYHLKNNCRKFPHLFLTLSHALLELKIHKVNHAVCQFCVYVEWGMLFFFLLFSLLEVAWGWLGFFSRGAGGCLLCVCVCACVCWGEGGGVVWQIFET